MISEHNKAKALLPSWASQLLLRSGLYILGFGLLLALTLATFHLPVFSSAELLFHGAFGDQFGIGRTASKATPLLLCGLGVIVAWKAGMFNIGGEGQFVSGGLLGAAVYPVLQSHHISGSIAIVCILVASAVGGAIWAGIAGFLKVRRGVDVVISTILLNFIAFQIMKWLVSGPMMEKSGGLPETPQITSKDILWHPNPQTDFHLGIAIAILVALVIWWIQYRTRFGLEMRVVGDNPTAARSNRLSSGRRQIEAMLISGALCGLAGGIEYSAMAGQIGLDFNQNWGFLAIPVALAAGLQPLYAIPSAIFFGSLFAGSVNLSRYTQSGDSVIYIIQAIVVLGLVAGQTWKMKSRRTGEVIG